VTEHGALSAILARTLGPWAASAPAIAAELAARGRGVSALEGSFRLAGGRLSGSRTMIERLDARAACAVLAALPIELDPASIVDRDDHPWIVGWDTAREPAVAKVYLNLSDVAARLRVAAARRLAIDGAIGAESAPHVIGLDITACDRAPTSIKIYRQSSALPRGASASLVALARAIDATGFVTAWQITGARATPRAMFLAPCEDGAPVTLSELAPLIPGLEPAACAGALGFEPGRVRSIGVALEGGALTVYVKPRGYGDVASDEGAFRDSRVELEPAICIARGEGAVSSVELGVFVVPAAAAERAYRHESGYALSYRVRAGRPTAAEITEVMEWAACRVAASQRLDAPPEGWHVVDP
jgi:hypothetical protein